MEILIYILAGLLAASISSLIVLLKILAEEKTKAKEFKERWLAEHDEAVRAREESNFKSRQMADTVDLFESRMAEMRREADAKDAERTEFYRLQLMQSERDKQALQEQMEARFRLMSNEILNSQLAELKTGNESHLSQILSPLKADIDRFRQDVTSFYTKESAERLSLQERIKELIATNDSIGREAKELATALRGNSKVQGDWGEMVLESILEKSGLRVGEEFEVQNQRDEFGKALKDEDGHGLRPDVVVKYPGGRVMVIDSKVSLTAFVNMCNAETEEDREGYGKQHLASVRNHIKELGAKSYQDYVGSDQKLDFVLMFIPNEAAYSAAMTLDHNLWQDAYDRRVLMVSPTQLVASLKIVSQLWRHDRQTRNAIEIANRSGAMYDKFVGFCTDMEKIGRALETTQTNYEGAMKKLRDGTGSLISRAEKLRELGVKTAKRLQASKE